jgi:hypothetical protein
MSVETLRTLPTLHIVLAVAWMMCVGFLAGALALAFSDLLLLSTECA